MVTGGRGLRRTSMMDGHAEPTPAPAAVVPLTARLLVRGGRTRGRSSPGRPVSRRSRRQQPGSGRSTIDGPAPASTRRTWVVCPPGPRRSAAGRPGAPGSPRGSCCSPRPRAARAGCRRTGSRPGAVLAEHVGCLRLGLAEAVPWPRSAGRRCAPSTSTTGRRQPGAAVGAVPEHRRADAGGRQDGDAGGRRDADPTAAPECSTALHAAGHQVGYRRAERVDAGPHRVAELVLEVHVVPPAMSTWFGCQWFSRSARSSPSTARSRSNARRLAYEPRRGMSSRAAVAGASRSSR